MADTAITPTTGSLALAGEDAYFINSGDSKLLFVGSIPVVKFSAIQMPTGSIGFAGNIPARPLGLEFIGSTPSLGRSTYHVTGSVSFGGDAPVIIQSDPPNFTVSPSTGSLNTTGYASSVFVQSIELATANLVLSGQSLDATQTTPVFPFFDQLATQGYAPIVSQQNFGTEIVNHNAITDAPNNYQIDDRTGFKIKVKDAMVKDYTGHWMRPESRDHRSEQEFLRSKPEHQRGPLRPEPVGSETFIDPNNPVDPDDL